MNCEKDFVNLWIFNCLMLNINLFIFNCLTSNFCFRKNVFGTLKKTAVCGLASVFSDFKLTRENDDLLPSRRKFIFEVPHPVHEYTIMRIPTKVSDKHGSYFLKYSALRKWV